MVKKHESSTRYGRQYPYHFPHALKRDWEFEEGKAKAIKAVKNGMCATDALQYAFEIVKSTAFYWVKNAQEDIEKGFTSEDSRLIDLILSLAKEELHLRMRLEKRANELALAEESNTDLLKFLLERRHGYIKQTQNDLEVSTPEDTNFEINIVDSKDVKEDE